VSPITPGAFPQTKALILRFDLGEIHRISIEYTSDIRQGLDLALNCTKAKKITSGSCVTDRAAGNIAEEKA